MLTFPNAKINIGLYVTEKRNDGYHNLETIFYPIPLCDILEIVPSSENHDVLTLTGLPVPGDIHSNLVLKAVHLLRQSYNFPFLNINLHKIIPMGAGLGGGSADAAFALRLINQQFNLNISEEKMIDYALQLGSDCPFFIKNKAQFAQGRGEKMIDVLLSLNAYYLLLVFPDIHIGTKQAFQGVTPGKALFDLKTLNDLPVEQWQQNIHNDFEKSVFYLHPSLKEIYVRINAMGAEYCQMTGSGSCIYGIFDSMPIISVDFNLNYKIIMLT